MASPWKSATKQQGGESPTLTHDLVETRFETAQRQGYRFIASVERAMPSQPNVALDTLLAPYRAFVDGRAALETLGGE